MKWIAKAATQKVIALDADINTYSKQELLLERVWVVLRK